VNERKNIHPPNFSPLIPCFCNQTMSSIKIIISLKYYLLTGITLYDMQHLIRQQASEAVSLEKSIG